MLKKIKIKNGVATIIIEIGKIVIVAVRTSYTWTRGRYKYYMKTKIIFVYTIIIIIIIIITIMLSSTYSSARRYCVHRCGLPRFFRQVFLYGSQLPPPYRKKPSRMKAAAPLYYYYYYYYYFRYYRYCIAEAPLGKLVTTRIQILNAKTKVNSKI